MSLVITNDSKNDKRPSMTRSQGQRAVNCPCGQQLDVCARAHCPRCGRTSNRR